MIGLIKGDTRSLDYGSFTSLYPSKSGKMGILSDATLGPKDPNDKDPFQGVIGGLSRDIWGLSRGIQDPDSGALAPQYYNLKGIWGLKPYCYLGLRTLNPKTLNPQPDMPLYPF